MCGIAGIIATGQAPPVIDEAELGRMADAMVSRGPDGSGRWVSADRKVGLAHRRLAIIELSEAGAQPMVDDETGCVITFNGEIYNFGELRADLERRGHRFRGHSDTEVLLRSYIEYGDAFLPKLRGMFAFAIWDPRRMVALLGRDPLGIKPLYVSSSGGVVRFASQVKALKAGRGDIDTGLEPAAAVGFLLWGYVPEPFTTCRGIRALPAGSCAIIDSRGLSAPRRYWSLREEILAAEAKALDPRHEAEPQALRQALEDSVRHHLVADVPVGVFLSAGIDSTAIAALAASIQDPRPVQTLTLAFDEFRGSAHDEGPIAERIGRLLKTDHRTVLVRQADFEAEAERALLAMDQPTVDGINTYFVSKAAHEAGLKVVLSGLGGDEIFCGYSSFKTIPAHVRRARSLSGLPWLGSAVRRATGPLLRLTSKPKAAGLLEYGDDFASSYMLHRCLFMPWELPSIVDPDLLAPGLQALDTLPRLRREIEGIRNPMLSITALEAGNYMRDQLLRDSDWASMAHSLEMRVPLVDSHLLRRILDMRAAGIDCSKSAVCRSASPAALAVIASRKKTGFGIPVTRWMGGHGSPERIPGHPMRRWALLIARRTMVVP